MEEILRDTSGDERDSEGRVKRRARLVWAEEEISFSFSFFLSPFSFLGISIMRVNRVMRLPFTYLHV